MKFSGVTFQVCLFCAWPSGIPQHCSHEADGGVVGRPGLSRARHESETEHATSLHTLLDSALMVPKLPLKRSHWKQPICIISPFLQVRNLHMAQLGASSSRPRVKLLLRCQAGLQSPLKLWVGGDHLPSPLAWLWARLSSLWDVRLRA